jgi:acyl-CoA dehydrogenase
LRVQHEASLQLAFHAALLLGREEAGEATEQERLALRLLLPVTKLLTAKQAVAAASETLESFGGAGYVEDTHLPVLLRDAQVLPIWEGTTNVLSMDALRAIRDDGTLRAFAGEVRQAAGTVTDDDLVAVGKLAVDATDHAAAWVVRALDGGPDALAHGARRFALTLGRALQAALLVAQAQHDLDAHGDGRAAAVARRFADEGIDLLDDPGRTLRSDAALARDEPI